MDNFPPPEIVDQGNFPLSGMQNTARFVNERFHRPGPPYIMKLFPLVSSFVIFYATSLFLRIIQKWRKDEIYKEQLKKEKNSTELSLLKQQINPHFIFNTLNNIYSLSISNSKAVSDPILRLSSILRYALYSSPDDMLRIDDELKIIDDYIQLQKLRLTDKVSVNYKLIREPAEYKIEPLIIITLLENAFKYGVDANSNSSIDILLVILNRKLILRIKNKIASQFLDDPRTSGIGLKNIQRRLDLVYPNRYKYNVDIKNMIYSVFLEIELDHELYSN